MKRDSEKMQERQETPALENKTTLQSFLGLTHCMRRFMYNYSTQTYHLRKLLKEKKDYIWTETHKQAFSHFKRSLSSDSCVSFFYSHEEAFIYADANPYGILEIYSQKSRNQEICVMGV